jgi:hypothetical protein
MKCAICDEDTTESRRVIGQGLYWYGMTEEERKTVAESITIIPCHNKCYTELAEED